MSPEFFSQPFSWQKLQWQKLLQAKESGKFPHALLLQGGEGIGKFNFAHSLAASILCKNDTRSSSKVACGECGVCHLLALNTHPDLLIYQATEDQKIIKVDQIRAVTQFLTLSSQYGGEKIVLLEQADRMNTAASNALLKTLEEPGHRAILLLTSHRPSGLSATVRSRCQTVKFQYPNTEEALAWLKTKQKISAEEGLSLLELANNAPLKILNWEASGFLEQCEKYKENFLALNKSEITAVVCAEGWKDFPLENSLTWLLNWIFRLIRLKFNIDLAQKNNEEGLALTEKISQQDLFLYLDKIKQAKNNLYKKLNLNSQLVLENLLIEWKKIC